MRVQPVIHQKIKHQKQDEMLRIGLIPWKWPHKRINDYALGSLNVRSLNKFGAVRVLAGQETNWNGCDITDMTYYSKMGSCQENFSLESLSSWIGTLKQLLLTLTYTRTIVFASYQSKVFIIFHPYGRTVVTPKIVFLRCCVEQNLDKIDLSVRLSVHQSHEIYSEMAGSIITEFGENMWPVSRYTGNGESDTWNQELYQIFDDFEVSKQVQATYISLFDILVYSSTTLIRLYKYK